MTESIDIASVESFEEYIDLTATQIDVFLSKTQRSDHFTTLFRGQENKTWRLLPKIGRAEYCSGGQDMEKIEQSILKEFKRLAYPFVSAAIEKQCDLCALAQHHGLPTRLLDWTLNPLAALWFACINEKNNNQDRAVWRYFAFDEEDFMSETDENNIIKIKTNKVFKPKHLSNRISSQYSWFTVHKLDDDHKFFLPLTAKDNSFNLQKIIIQNASRDEMLNKLNVLGVNAFSLFPNLDGLCQYLDWIKFKCNFSMSLKDRKKLFSKT